MVVYLEQIATAAYTLLKNKFQFVFDGVTDRPELAKRFDGYLRQLPVIGFNSGKYDLNVIKTYLTKYFVIPTVSNPMNVDIPVEPSQIYPSQQSSQLSETTQLAPSQQTESQVDDSQINDETQFSNTPINPSEVDESEFNNTPINPSEVDDESEPEEDEETEVFIDDEVDEGEQEDEETTTFDDKPSFEFIVKKNNNFMCLATTKLKFLDVTNYLAPGFSYSKYLDAYGVPEQKGVFCYEYLTDIAQLNERQLPPHSAFFSTLKNKNITSEEYAECQKVWTDKNMKTLRDFLVWYNNKDVVPFLVALDRQVAFYATLGVDMFKDAISVPGITLKYLFKTLPQNVMFTLCGQKNKDLHTTIRNNITGGPSIIFHRYHEKEETHISGQRSMDKARQNDSKTVQSIKGYDANALYLWALMQDMPSDFTVIRHCEDEFVAHRSSLYIIQNRQYLSWIAHSKNIPHLQTRYNGREHVVGERRIPVDGWDRTTKTAYQFHGCMFHGHPDCRITKDKTTHPTSAKPLTQLYTETCDIRNYLVNDGKVTVVEMWECEWQDLKKADPIVRDYVNKTFRYKQPSYSKYPRPTETQIKQAITNGTLFGLVECDIHVPENLKKYFEEMTPIFKNIEVGREDIGPLMRKYAENHKVLTAPRRTLIGSYLGEKILLATPLLKWYLAKGLQITKIYQVVEYQPSACFKQFGDAVTDARRQGDLDARNSITSETMKLLGNSAYGKTLTNKTKHVDIAYVGEGGMSKLLNTPLFKRMSELTPGVFEVESLKKKIMWDLPLQIGFFVYQYAKLKMLQFYYDFLDVFIDRADFQLCEMDTDSLYLALSSANIKDVVRPEKLTEFYRVYDRWFPAETCARHRTDFITHFGKKPDHCNECLTEQRLQKRTPGLFKLEYEGNAIVSLCSKTYYCDGESTKISTKGLSKTQNQNILTLATFKDVLASQRSGGGTNTGFRALDGHIYTYQQHRQALSYFYIKRVVDDEGESTSPLSI